VQKAAPLINRVWTVHWTRLKQKGTATGGDVTNGDSMAGGVAHGGQTNQRRVVA